MIITNGDEKLVWRYSVIARQYALEKDAYDFFEIMKKNTEDLGTFFGPLPSEVKGNIHCLSQPDEAVLGFVTASGVSEKRIFIDKAEVPYWPNYAANCPEIQVAAHTDSIQHAIALGFVPSYFIPSPVNKYLFSTPYCVDCVSRGGSNIRPSFW